jgi:hypothetical protein
MAEIDLSELPYEEWLGFFFARDVDPYGDLWHQYHIARPPAQPDQAITYLTRMCRDFAMLPPQCSWEQINQGVWAVFSYPAEMADFLMQNTVPLELRLECIRAMYHVYADVIAKLDPAITMENCFYMWWDTIAEKFCRSSGYEGMGQFNPADDEHRQMQKVILETLVRILHVGEHRCEFAALHGLGHLRHAEGVKAIQEYIVKHADDLTPDDLDWLKECRDGTMM